MPELPEVETMRRGVAPAAGAVIRDIRRGPSRLQSITITPPLATIRRRVRGRTIAEVTRIGKRVVLVLDSGDRLVMEPRMSGLVLLNDPPDRAHLRVIVELAGRVPQLLFWDQRGLGVLRLVSPDEFTHWYGPAKLGPDALTITPAELRARLCGSRRPIKVALLDQRALAGIGNLYASEILHRVRIHPATPCNELRAGQWQRIHAAMGAVLADAIAHQGSTLRDGTYRIAHNEPGQYQLCHWVYQRAGELCLLCRRGRIVRIVQAQRSTFFCPRCQKQRV
jgi:formamidopyrimidine-DNA glycosylase